MPAWAVYVKWGREWFEIRSLRAETKEAAERAFAAEPRFCLHESIFEIHILPVIATTAPEGAPQNP